MKPISTVPRALDTVDTATGEATKAQHQRSDVCAVPPAAVVAEAMVALVLADALLAKTGGDSVAEVRRNLEAYVAVDPGPAGVSPVPGPHIVLVGPPGSGKSTWRCALGERWQLAVRDTDADVEATAGQDDRRDLRRGRRAACSAALERDAVRVRPRRARRRARAGWGRRPRRAHAGAASPVTRRAERVVVFLDVTPGARRPARRALNQARPLLLGQPACAVAGADGGASARLRARSRTVRVLTDGQRPADVAELIEQELAVLRRGEGSTA